ncbi:MULTISPECIES: TIGR01621 family pseudouridine synthase [Deefgea]|uniref:TIGR01621 family pseudouridine synthase n=1 Tax=Deefgea chitinilytica TaxID=570276 RepID=A0ABS2C765_9NEIS|nr:MULTISPECIES: TIGR01621 family pseudouridine synthase [Deefgea]MBM5570000.1 TIGR01621 family pseudouridine synthase [Deefgea chitinilytica]MBM9887229.1 TIGR01621 family pseudouridine synthase [Deefgea sp. CFH1-16]
MTTSIPILALTDDFVLIDKPAGLDFHQNDEQVSLIELVRQQTGIDTLLSVHRLDKMTSGLLLFARNPETARSLGEQFAEHRIEKFYLAISDAKPNKKQGKIQGGMEKGRGGNWKFVRSGGQLATTQFFSYGLGEGLRLFLLRPRTGRTHQLRVALKSLGSPILGDSRYASSNADRGYLHAYAIEFNLAGNTHRYICQPTFGTQFQSPECQAQLQQLPAPWDLAWPK